MGLVTKVHQDLLKKGCYIQTDNGEKRDLSNPFDRAIDAAVYAITHPIYSLKEISRSLGRNYVP